MNALDVFGTHCVQGTMRNPVPRTGEQQEEQLEMSKRSSRLLAKDFQLLLQKRWNYVEVLEEQEKAYSRKWKKVKTDKQQYFLDQNMI